MSANDNFTVDLPFGPPPILPDIGKQLEEYLTKPDKLPIHNGKQDFKFWPRKVDLYSLYHTDVSPVTTTIKVKRDLTSGELLDFTEIPIQAIGQTANSSTSFSRPPGKVTDDVRGNRTNFPFWPGGALDPIQDENLWDENFSVNFKEGLLTKAPGLSRGYDFNEQRSDVTKTSGSEAAVQDEDEMDIINLKNIIQDMSPFDSKPEGSKNKSVSGSVSEDSQNKFTESEEDVIPQEVKLPVLRKSTEELLRKPNTRKLEWAELLDTTKPVVDFDKRIPNPAVTWKFELDTFQKLAILKLEKHEHVFVGAHTSAGKTVVAEYAIGLAQKHCTKVIYTSPIKALSNQKYGDFKKKFSDVGLITGDFQINQQASCLIMTTEILRSMLYAGSDIIRDLEFVIFDEVHYINDFERGHVWEEIVIMLPDTVCIVMLSATVPNMLEFADWVGRTKCSKMYVVSTIKRPVPLQHYLYTGKGKLFLIRDGDGPFIVQGYHDAMLSLLPKDNKEKDQQGKDKPKYKQANKRGDLKQALNAKLKSQSKQNKSNNYLIDFARFLQEMDKLPIVAFTLSRAKCDNHAESLIAIDLVDSKEKDYIKHYFRQCIKHLKDEDQNLPQIKKMGRLLEQGIGVHHSGILPILKEIVETLFEKGLVKFLFATETFAMGVNMPARTVSFDSIKKYDGSGIRVLEPAEYIQMAGRAGRRGKDSVGTVIILIREDMVDMEKLRNMMLGRPTILQSQFRLTYSMILNLLRVKVMKVEDIMSHSFKELHRRNVNSYKKELSQLKEEVETARKHIQNQNVLKKLELFYDDVMAYVNAWNDYSAIIFKSREAEKRLTVGRFVIATYKQYMNRLALIIQIKKKPDSIEYRVLILRDKHEVEETEETVPNLFYQILGLSTEDIFVPSGKPVDELITITSNLIKEITQFEMRIKPELIINGWEQRQIPRFKDSPPSPSCAQAITELSERSLRIHSSNDYASNFITLNDLNIKELTVSEYISKINSKRIIINCNISKEIPDFKTQFKAAFDIKQKEDRKYHLQFLLSSKSLLLYPDYENRLEVLRALNYIDNEGIVQMKGNVACGMGSNELIITELIFQHTFYKFEPAEIAALLSSLVFQVKSNEQEKIPDVPENLLKGIESIMTVHNEIYGVEKKYNLVNQEKDEQDKLNFGLVEVVYKWAHGEPFSEIMKLVGPKVQEGIIVRSILQLNEILGDIRDAAKLFGDVSVKKKMEEASEAIKRDIVFTESLYTREDVS